MPCPPYTVHLHPHPPPPPVCRVPSLHSEAQSCTVDRFGRDPFWGVSQPYTCEQKGLSVPQFDGKCFREPRPSEMRSSWECPTCLSELRPFCWLLSSGFETQMRGNSKLCCLHDFLHRDHFPLTRPPGWPCHDSFWGATGPRRSHHLFPHFSLS